MGHDHTGHAEHLSQVLDQLVDVPRDDRIEAGGGLVIEDHLRIKRQRACEANALLLTAGEVLGILVRMVRPVRIVTPHRHQVELDLHHQVDHILVQVGVLDDRSRDVLRDGHAVEQGAVLKQHTECLAGSLGETNAVRRIDDHPQTGRQALDAMIEQHLTARRRLDPRDDPQQGALSTARSPHDHRDLAPLDLEGDGLDHRAVLQLVGLGQAGQSQRDLILRQR